MVIQMVDIVMIKHVTPMFSWKVTPSLPLQGYLLLNALNVIKTDSTMCTKLAQISQNSSLFNILAKTIFALVSDF